MSGNKLSKDAGSNFTQALDAASRLPGVRIDRVAYLRSALKRYCTQEQIERAIAESPAAAGIPLKVITEAANNSITFPSPSRRAKSPASRRWLEFLAASP
jgi:hypothetical protein